MVQIVVDQMPLGAEDEYEDDDEYEADKRCITIVLVLVLLLVLDKGIFQKSTSEVFSKLTLSERQDQAD